MSNPNNIIVLSLTALGIAVIGVIGALAIWGSASNPMIATATGQIGTILVAMIGALVAFRVGVDAKAAAVDATVAAKVAIAESIKSKDSSRKNADTLSNMVETVETMHGIVNHSKDLMEAELAESRKTASAQSRENASLRAALLALQTAPGSEIAAKLIDAIPAHPLDSPTPAADAAKAEQAQKPATASGPVKLPPNQPKAGPGEHQ